MSDVIDLCMTWDRFSDLPPTDKENLRAMQCAFLGGDLKAAFGGKEWAVFSGLEKIPRATGDFSNVPSRQDLCDMGKAFDKPTFLHLSDVTIDFI